MITLGAPVQKLTQANHGPVCGCSCADVALFVCPRYDQHLSAGTSTYTFYTLGPDLEHGVGLYQLHYDAGTTILGVGFAYGHTTLVSDWASKGFLHRFGSNQAGSSSSLSTGGMLVGIFVGCT
jgi:hypothetical protein